MPYDTFKRNTKIYFHVYRANSSPHNQNRYAHGSIVSYGKYSFLKVFLILWKIEVESPIFFHDKYDLNYASSRLNIYKATFLFDSWALWPPEIWHCIFMTNQVSQYVLWDDIHTPASLWDTLLLKVSLSWNTACIEATLLTNTARKNTCHIRSTLTVFLKWQNLSHTVDIRPK